MAYYAKVLKGKVVEVIKADASYFDDFIDTSPGTWIETYKGNLTRGQFAGVGMTYDKAKDAFYGIPEYKSWTLNETTWEYEPPLAMPADADSVNYMWDEDAYQSDNTTGWSVKS
jgi:hypothetical protein